MAVLDKVVNPNVARSLAVWHEMVESKDLARLDSIVHPDATFRSPMAVHPYSSRPALILALSTVIQIFENFTYHRQLASPDGLNVVLEFSANVTGKKLKDGQIVDFEVMVRPLNGLQALGAEMGRRLGDKLSAFKDKAKL